MAFISPRSVMDTEVTSSMGTLHKTFPAMISPFVRIPGAQAMETGEVEELAAIMVGGLV